jgi:8-oxo-dGTP diphosphatase
MNLYSRYKKHLVAVDCIVFGYNILDKELKLLLIKRSFNPAKGKWSLTGGFVDLQESLDIAANRILISLTGLGNIYMQQSHAYSDPERDPGARVISVAYWSIIKLKDIDNDLRKKNGAQWHSINSLPHLIFDHKEMVARALRELRTQIKIKPVGFELLPEKFTLVQLLDLYEAIYQRTFDKRNFRKKILSMDILEKLDEKEKETSKRGAYYYRFNEDQYNKLIMNGFYFNLDVN